MVNVGIIGYGYWGPNLTRNFMELPDTQMIALSDLSQENLQKAHSRYPSLQVTTNYLDIINSPGIDAVVIATPVSTHFDLGMQALKAGKHILLEKPLASSCLEAKQLIEEADKRGLVLMVDHTFVYTGAVRKVKDLVSGGDIGESYYYDSVRINLGKFQSDVNVIWDLAVHDLSIMDYVFPNQPVAVSATGIHHVATAPVDVAYMTLFFEENFISHIHVNWLAPVKIRKTIIGGSKKMIIYDDLEVSEKVKVYDNGIIVDDKPENIHNILVSYRTGDMWAPRLQNLEALRGVAQEFADSIAQSREPLTGGTSGMNVVKVLEAASISINKQGQPIQLK
ncbi:MAG: Gfo/Idh/MocA family oxidoreductase [Anaerolineales bacterium]|nr:Gfo/Idh/MocA family oxidoreductase [Anaerolineales bacterium]